MTEPNPIYYNGTWNHKKTHEGADEFMKILARHLTVDLFNCKNSKLKDIAGVPKPGPKDDHVLVTARNMGICMGD